MLTPDSAVAAGGRTAPESLMPRLVARVGRKAGVEYRLGPEHPRVRLGRHGTNYIQILDSKASREHAEIVYDEGAFILRDLKSRNGTWLNGAPVRRDTVLKPGDRIRIGDNIYELVADAPDEEIEDAEPVEEPEPSGGLRPVGEAPGQAADEGEATSQDEEA